MKLTDFDRIQCVCVDHRRNDWAAIEKPFKERGAKVERFIVGKGEALPRSVYNQIDPPTAPQSWTGFTYNAYCCYLAHRAIISKAKKDGLKNILLLEDDCQLLDNFDEVLVQSSKQIRELNLKWDTLTFGQNLKWAKVIQLSPNLLKLERGAYCWHAIAISQENHDMFQHFLDLPAQGAFDYLWANYTQPHFECLGLWPSIAIQKPGMSFVLSSMQDYTDWLKEKGNNDIT
jgi:hypothetical protein